MLLSGEKGRVSGGQSVPETQGCSASVAGTIHTQKDRTGPALAALAPGGSSPLICCNQRTTKDTLVRSTQPGTPGSRCHWLCGDGEERVKLELSYPTSSLSRNWPAQYAPGSSVTPIVDWRADLTLGTLSVVLAGAEVATMAMIWVSMPNALPRLAATEPVVLPKLLGWHHSQCSSYVQSVRHEVRGQGRKGSRPSDSADP